MQKGGVSFQPRTLKTILRFRRANKVNVFSIHHQASNQHAKILEIHLSILAAASSSSSAVLLVRKKMIIHSDALFLHYFD